MLCSVELQRRLDSLGRRIGVGALWKRVENDLFLQRAAHPLQDGAQGFNKLAVFVAGDAGAKRSRGGFFGLPSPLETP